ncbi:uncharacterized protein N7506_009327 [Penicillium brevicompactum]|uniref:uncharacterized protein n=1 Tax=Penicillium brevicompactum TaxID=5074 RepID=UPI0025417F37|nr:uncharacterized protein N7506_009327 [Penicillium brevicompactum]KAJ5326225.1 hypothetical protein N7506_009327 [Penicillium brevicompactum]
MNPSVEHVIASLSTGVELARHLFGTCHDNKRARSRSDDNVSAGRHTSHAGRKRHGSQAEKRNGFVLHTGPHEESNGHQDRCQCHHIQHGEGLKLDEDLSHFTLGFLRPVLIGVIAHLHIDEPSSHCTLLEALVFAPNLFDNFFLVFDVE